MKQSDMVKFSLTVTLASLALVVTTTSVLAKGTFARITISGGRLTSEIAVTDPALLGFGSLSAFPKALPQPPQLTGDG